jgi:hypothetical protein
MALGSICPPLSWGVPAPDLALHHRMVAGAWKRAREMVTKHAVPNVTCKEYHVTTAEMHALRALALVQLGLAKAKGRQCHHGNSHASCVATAAGHR